MRVPCVKVISIFSHSLLADLELCNASVSKTETMSALITTNKLTIHKMFNMTHAMCTGWLTSLYCKGLELRLCRRCLKIVLVQI